MNFPKGMKIGHLEPPIDELTQIPINSATTQQMLPETIKPDSFTPPKYQLDSTIQQQLDNLLGTFKDQFAKDKMTIGTTPLTQMSINTGDSDPVSQKPYPVAMKHYNWVKEEIDKLLEAGVIRNSHSSWSASIIVVPKGDGGKRLVIDYRALNKVMRKFVWPMPKVEDIFSQLNGAKYFSTLDLRARYHHIRLTADSIPKTAFTSSFGRYEYVKVPFVQFLNGKNENTKINRWGLELASYNIKFEWISGAKNKAADCLSRLVELPKKHQNNPNGTKPMLINMVKAITTRSRTRNTTLAEGIEEQPPIRMDINTDSTPSTEVSKETTSNNIEDNSRDTSVKEMQSMDPFCKHIMKRLLNKTAPKHELDTFFIHNGLLYRYVSDHSKDFCALVISQSLEIHDLSRNT